MGCKSRGNFPVMVCLKADCANRGERCRECVRWSEYERKEKERDGKHADFNM